MTCSRTRAAGRLAPPAAGYLAWLDFRPLGAGDEVAAELVERGRVALGRGLDFGTVGAGFARLTYATSPAVLEEVVRRGAAAHDLLGAARAA